MANAQALFKWTVGTALDRLTGSRERTEEGIGIITEMWRNHTAQDVISEIDEAKHEASDPATLRKAIEEAAAESGQVLSDKQRESLEITVVSALSSSPDKSQGSEAIIDNLAKQLLPGKSRSYVIWLDTPPFVGEGEGGRYFHFSYDGESYRVRDFIGGKIFHPPGPRVTDKEWKVIELKMRASEIWNASKGQTQCTKEHGMYLAVTERDKWRQKLLSLTDAVK